MTEILIADDHPLVRDALARTLQAVLPDARVHLAHDFDSTEAALRHAMPALALVDLHMPGMLGLQGVQRLRRMFPALRLAVASGQDDPGTIRQVLALGAAGFLPKSDPPEQLQQALRLMLSGATYVPARSLADLRDGVLPPRPDLEALTARQAEVLRLLMRGQPNKLIARELDLTEGTVKIHIAAILRVLHARNRTEAVVRARELGFA